MSTTTPNKTPRVVLASTSNPALGTIRSAVVDLRAALGGYLTIKLNTVTAPTVQCVATVLIAHSSTIETAAAEGLIWKQYPFFVGSGILASTSTSQGIAIDQSVMQFYVEFTGNTGQAVTCEAFFSAFTSYSTV